MANLLIHKEIENEIYIVLLIYSLLNNINLVRNIIQILNKQNNKDKYFHHIDQLLILPIFLIFSLVVIPI
jgi:hypothetical protein